MHRVFNNFHPGPGKSFRIVLHLGARQLALRCGFAIMIVAAALPAQNRQTTLPIGRKMHSVERTARADSASAPQKPMPNQPHPLPAPSPNGDTPNAPRVSYKGGQLTIIAENSELSAILSLVSARTGAEIDLPAGVLNERIWSEFGPGPARKVLATLLTAMRLDYAIQASDVDPQGIRRVLLKARTKLDAGNVPEQENPISTEPQPSPEATPVNLPTASAESQPPTETQESTANEPPTFTEVQPAGFQTSMEAANNFGTKYFRLGIVIPPNPDKSIAEGQRVTVYVGHQVGVGGTAMDIPVNDNKGAIVWILVGAYDKLPRMSREMFVGDPVRLPSQSELANEK
jgi:hypothetical protein